MCQNDSGLCDEWDPVAGGNRALLFPRAGLAPAPVPEGDETLLAETCGSDCTVRDASPCHEARGKWSEAYGRPLRDVLGQLGGTPSWLQHDETPACPSCARPMSFMAQLEEGRDHGTAMNSPATHCHRGAQSAHVLGVLSG